MAVPKKYLKSAEGAIASYDYADIAEGQGYTIYYGAKTTSGANMVTRSTALRSELPHTSVTNGAGTTTFAKIVDEDFDIEFNLPKNVKGTIYASVPIGIYPTDGPADYTFKATCKFYHVDLDGTETQLGSDANSFQYWCANCPAQQITSQNALCGAEVATVRHFKKGEILRITVEMWSKTTEAAGKTCAGGIGHNPAGTGDYSYDVSGNPANEYHKVIEGPYTTLDTSPPDSSTQLSFHVPFVLDL